MSITIQNFTDVMGKDVFTTKGIYSGKVSNLELDLDKFKIKSLIVNAVKGSFLAEMVGDKKGVIIPFSMIQSIGDVVIMKHVTPSTVE